MKGVVFSLFIVLAVAATFQHLQGSTSAVIIVNTNRDGGTDGACSLREAITAANLNLPIDGCPAGTPGDIPGDVIQFAEPWMVIEFSLSGINENANQTGDLDILESLVIQGFQASVNAQQIDRVFHVHAGSVIFQDISIRGGDAHMTGGGGINIQNDVAQVILDRVTVEDNFARIGGGIFSSAPLVIRQSAIVNNGLHQSDLVQGGGIFIVNELLLDNSTVSQNDVPSLQPSGGGILIGEYSVAVIRNSTLTENSPENVTVSHAAFAHFQDSIVTQLNTLYSDCTYLGTGISISGGYNILPETGECGALTETDIVAKGPLLGPLDYWGGMTMNYLLLPRTAGVDNGSCSDGEVAVDQRGVSRPQGEGCDIGAHERDELTSLFRLYLPIVLK